DQGIFWIGSRAEVRRLRRYLPEGDEFEKVGEIQLPRQEPTDRSRRGDPGGPGGPGAPGARRAGGGRRGGVGGRPGGRPGGGGGLWGLAPGTTYSVYKLTKK
ncbi:MAG: hypothetical protein ACYTKC_21050, partial [Planctomycetota bacterium]